MHSDTLTVSDVREALETAKKDGNVDSFVHFMILEERGSRTRKNGFEIRLEWIGEKVKGDGRHWTNSGNGGANSYGNGNGTYVATHDEWGWFIAELFSKDSDMVFGTSKAVAGFDEATRYKYGY